MRKTLPFLLLISFLHLFAQSQNRDPDTLHLDRYPGLYNIVVAINDSIRYNQHFNGTKDADVFDDQSLTKSMGSLLIGIAIDKGLIPSLDTKLTYWFPQLKTDKDKRKQEITLRQLMNQASGLRHEDLGKPNGIGEYLAHEDLAGYVLNAPLVSAPGAVFHYNNAATHLLGIILTKSSGMDLMSFAKKNLLAQLDIVAVEWQKTRDGYYDLAGLENIRLRTADWIKIGSLLLHEGRYHQKQVVPAKWIAQIIHPDISYPTEWGFHPSQYGLCWYHITYKGQEMIYGLGWGGQFLIVVPGLQMVLAINQSKEDQNAIRRAGRFMQSVFPAFFDAVTRNQNL
ncbi:MAG TPA: serine hydrolase [Puia sp.]|nr:serine hydrolase [Puia sp.]